MDIKMERRRRPIVHCARRTRMPAKDILLPLVGEPSEGAIAAVARCVAVAGALSATVEAVVVEEDIPVRPIVTALSAAADTGAIGAPPSVTDVRALLDAFEDAAARLSVRSERTILRLAAADVAPMLAQRARLKDLSLIPVKANSDQSERIVERLLFASGRPALLCPEELAAGLPVAFDNVLIAWDHSAPAARAVADALPLLRSAGSVRIMTATDRATADELQSGAALLIHLARHGIKASFATVKIEGSSIGKILEAHVRSSAADLLVMGAYHHSRLNEIIWGGATKTVIGRPPCWV